MVTTQQNGSTENYRLLKNVPVYSWESAGTTGNSVAAADKSYTKSALMFQSGQAGSGISKFCANCHGDYRPERAEDKCSQCHGDFWGYPEGVPLSPGGVRWIHKVDDWVHMYGPQWALDNLTASNYKLPVEHEVGWYEGFYEANVANPKDSGAGTFSRFVGGARTPRGYVDSFILGCLTCHNAHGSVATAQSMDGNRAGTHSLLRFDERAVCQSCHKKSPDY